MSFRWATDSRWSAAARRGLAICAAACLIGVFSVFGALPGQAAPGVVGNSPANPVVAKAPLAVSVTFAEPLGPHGAHMRVLTSAGDVGTGRVTTAARTLRRDLAPGAPAGAYTVEWTAQSADGTPMSGTFTFFAARGNEARQTPPQAVSSPAAAPGAGSGPGPATATEAGPGPGRGAAPAGGPTAPGRTVPDAVGAPVAGAPNSPGAPGDPGATGATAQSSRPAGAPDPDGTTSLGTTGSLWSAAQRPSSGTVSDAAGVSPPAADRLTGSFTAVPLTVGALLVLAAGLVSLVNRRHQPT